MTNRSTQGIAQSFFVEPEPGIFLTSVDLFFKAKHDTLPVFVELRPMKNGVPSSEEVMQGSEVTLSPASVNISDDASSSTTFVFEEPVYLSPQTDYALVVFTPSKDYEIYVAEVGEFVLGSTATRIKSQPYTGSLFLTQNLSTWTPDQNKDLKFVLNRAEFWIENDTEAVFYNNSVPKELLPADPIVVDSGSTTITVSHRDHGFQIGDTVTLSGIDSADTVGGIAGTTLLGDHTITAIDYTGYQFTADSAASSSEIGGGSNVVATRNILFDSILPNIETLTPPTCFVEFEGAFTTGKSFAGSETAYAKGSYMDITNKIGRKFDAPKVIGNRAIETTELGASTYSLDVRATFSSQWGFVAPFIDMQRASLYFQGNMIDNQDSAATSGFNVPLNWVSETDPLEGSAAAKHISETITLIEDAVGIKIILSANRPPEADFHVYYKTGTDETDFDTSEWTLIEKENAVPADDDRRIFRDYEYLIGGEGGNLPAFTKFKIKIVMTSTNSSKPPIFRDMRMIALGV